MDSDGEMFRARVRSLLAENLPAGWSGIGALSDREQEEFRTRWRRLLHENGLLAVGWPIEYGGSGLSPREQLILAEECTTAG
ncbi:acyl-CoA dehydrogenase family protein, partial [Frankia sp. AvcI1]